MTDASEVLLKKAFDSLRGAEALIREELYDFAASRAYYAMFYIAEAFLAKRGSSYSSHAAVISAFGKTFAKTGILDVKFHQRLIAAQDLRNIGDYALISNITKEQAQKLMDWGQEFISLAEVKLRET